MKKFLWLAVLALALPVATWANSTQLVFGNNGGKLSTNGSTLTLAGSTLSSFTMGGTTYTGSLGSVSFTTGSLLSGTLGGGGTFNAGGSFTITGNGSNGIPNGALFTGAFSGPVTWTANYNTKVGNWTYTLTGSVQGTLSNGTNAYGGTMQLSFDVSNNQQFGVGHSARLKSGVTTVTVPEPGTLSLFGTGILGLAGFLRRKFTT